jgi:hypothetical protein
MFWRYVKVVGGGERWNLLTIAEQGGSALVSIVRLPGSLFRVFYVGNDRYYGEPTSDHQSLTDAWLAVRHVYGASVPEPHTPGLAS